MNSQPSANMFYYPHGNNSVDYSFTNDNNYANPYHLSNIFNNKITASIPPMKNDNYNNPFLFPQHQKIGFDGDGNGGNDDDNVNFPPVTPAVVIGRGGKGIEERIKSNNNNNDNDNKKENSTINDTLETNGFLDNSSNFFLSPDNNKDDDDDDRPSYHHIDGKMVIMIENNLKKILAAMPLLPLPVFVQPNTDDININLEINNLIPFYLQPQQQQKQE